MIELLNIQAIITEFYASTSSLVFCCSASFWQWRQSVSNIVKVQSPSHHLSYSPPFPSPFSFPLEVAFLIQLGGLGSAVSSHSEVWSEAPAANDFGAFWGWRNAAGGIQDAWFQTTENGFSLHCYEEIFQRANYCFHSVVTLLWGSKP